MSNRNSFSKWCLQYSPVPVVVVRPTEKRLKKKKKRDADPARQDYAKILKDSGMDKHETDSGTHNASFEPSNDPTEEAHAVATALGLPAAFDPTLLPHKKSSRTLERVESGQSAATTRSQGSQSPDASPPDSPTALMKSPKSRNFDSPAMSVDDSSEGEDDEEGEFEAVDGRTLLGNANQIPELEKTEFEKKMKLHEMEVGEAQALQRTHSSRAIAGPYGDRKMSIGSQDSTGSAPGGVAIDGNDEEDDDSFRDESPDKEELESVASVGSVGSPTEMMNNGKKVPRDRRGSILSIWRKGKDEQGYHIIKHDDEEWKRSSSDDSPEKELSEKDSMKSKDSQKSLKN